MEKERADVDTKSPELSGHGSTPPVGVSGAKVSPPSAEVSNGLSLPRLLLGLGIVVGLNYFFTELMNESVREQ